MFAPNVWRITLTFFFLKIYIYIDEYVIHTKKHVIRAIFKYLKIILNEYNDNK